ncbi:MAG: FAD-dependent oxidoreductase [Burkholderiaceae bacterium]
MAGAARVAIVGAGISGLSCATGLAEAGLQVEVFEAGPVPGGRMGGERGQPIPIDHGAQYFTVRDPAFQAQVAQWIAAGRVTEWPMRLGAFGRDGWRSSDSSLKRHIGIPWMAAPSQHLADRLAVTYDHRVATLRHSARQWLLQRCAADAGTGPFDAVVLAMPAPLAATLLAGHSPLLADLYRSANMRACWAAMLEFDQPLPIPFDAAFINEGPLRWIANHGTRPGHPVGQHWLLHAGAVWSEANRNLSADEAIAQLLAALHPLGLPATWSPRAARAHLWPWADCQYPLARVSAWDDGQRLGLCGDWLNGGKVEGAWVSGRHLASQLRQVFT